MVACEESVEGYKVRATNLLSRLHSLPAHKLSPSALSRLSKLVNSELRFLNSHPLPTLNSTNLGYLEAVVQVLQHPHIDAVSAVLHTFRVTSSGRTIEAHVDVVCTFHVKPVWIVVSDRNPKYLYWSVESSQVKSWNFRVQQLATVAQLLNVLRPSAVLFCFARGVPGNVLEGFEGAIGASRIYLFEEPNLNHANAFEDSHLKFRSRLIEEDDGDWVCIHVSAERAYLDSCITFQVDINSQLDEPVLSQRGGFGVQNSISIVESQGDTFPAVNEQHEGIHQHEGIDSHSGACDNLFCSCLAIICRHSQFFDQKQAPFPTPSFVPMQNIVNLDTTALIALVSEVSNGAASTVVNMSSEDLVLKFKSTAHFMKDQAIEELKRPLMKEMTILFENRRPFMSETVCKKFKSLVSLCGSFKEKIRAEELLQVIPVVADAVSTRVRSLSETGKIKEKNKVIFGTGDFWQAPTLTANLSFVRAVRQTGL
ncbi:hypothetical protein GOP47_0001614 [Adiantum capillus-veneris]|uniref:DUF1308 domain-containing protein n=1 Tax=Adiantum capillus-veneris TaxID=13818 RepID=A0A9D4V8L1_ADICA|nr:hypothetical protein GOP47_0001614 [Adiantum capillus-veneris]